MCGKINSRPILMIMIAIIMLTYASMSTWKSIYIITDASTATEIQVSFMVSAAEAIKTPDFKALPFFFK